MKFTEEGIYHVYNRGNKKQITFFKEENYLYFLRKVRTQLLPYCEILAYCLMPNHFHFIVSVKSSTDARKPFKNGALNNGIAVLLRSYTRSMQAQEGFTGSLFQQKTKAKELIDFENTTINYLSICAHYIHLNPLNAKLVENLEEWKFSSYLDYMKLRDGTLCNKVLFYSIAGLNEKDFCKETEIYISISSEVNRSSDDEKKFYY